MGGYALYNKKDKKEIANYRLITLLNTDYKILTKSLMNQLARIADVVIHQDQAGFMKGQSIFN